LSARERRRRRRKRERERKRLQKQQRAPLLWVRGQTIFLPILQPANLVSSSSSSPP
jgi:hypothetical protein